MDRLGEKYTIDAIYHRLIDNQRLPELYVTHYPVRGRTPLMELEWEMKRLNRMDGIRLLFELFVAILRLCTGETLRENKSLPLSPMLREEVRKLEQYDKDLQLLCRYHIDTPEELSAFREENHREDSRPDPGAERHLQQDSKSRRTRKIRTEGTGEDNQSENRPAAEGTAMR